MSATTDSAKIREEELLHVSYDRVNKLDAPLLIIGLGGTGSDIVRTVKSTLALRFKLPHSADGTPIPVPPRTGYLVIDSDTSDKGGLENNEVVIIKSAGFVSCLSDPVHKDLTPSEKGWIHRDLHSIGGVAATGAGTHRAASRLMLERNYTKVYNAILNALSPLVKTEIGATSFKGSAQIVIATGIGGGTGSGTFLDIGQIIRHMMRSEPALNSVPYNLTCYIVMPDLTIMHLMEEGTPAMIPIIRRNGYAALKELDFWMDYDRHHCRYAMDYNGEATIEWGKPFDHVVLMSGTDVNSTLHPESYKLVQRTVAENLLHYMADEIVQPGANGIAQYSFQSYEDNLEAQLTTCRQKPDLLPLAHTYRAVGAFSKRIPKVKILYTEGRILFETFIPPRDDHGNLVPNNSLLTDHKASDRFYYVARKDFKTLYRGFANGVPYPRVCGAFNAADNRTVDALRKLNTPAHDSTSYESWRENSVVVPATKCAEEYKNEVWAAFRDLCRQIMADPAFGPFSLLQYLKDPGQSLRRAFATYASNAQGMVANLKSDVAKWRQVCENSYASFLKPPVLAGQKPVKTYLDALRELLNSVRQYELAKHYEQVMRLTVLYIDAYIQDALEPLCKVLEALEGDFKRPSATTDDLGSDLFDVSTLQQEVTDTFSDANKEKTVSRSFLGKLCDSSFDAVRNVNVGTCGLTFTFRQEGRLKAMQLMKQELDACFKQINSQSLDSVIQIQCADSNPAVQQRKQDDMIDSMARTIVDNAMPLFSLKQLHHDIPNKLASCLYFSVPDDSPAVLNRLQNGCPVTAGANKLTPKECALRDHIYCNVTYDGLPLYSYSLMDDLKKDYDAALAAGTTYSLHLVWDGDPNGDYRHNWCKLPDPAPFYLVRQNSPSAIERQEYDRVRKLVDRAKACGLLSIDSTVAKPIEFPTYTFRSFRKGGQPEHVETLRGRLQEALDRRDPTTGQPITPDQKLKGLQELLWQAERRSVQAAKSPVIMAAMLGFTDSTLPLNPFDPNIAVNPVKQRQAAEHFDQLTVEYATHILLSDPALLFDLEYQLKAFEEIADAMHAIEKESQLWEPRIAYAQRYAALYTFGLVSFDQMDNPTYVDESGETCPLIQPALFRDDLKSCETLVKAVGVAADLDPQHAIRRSLEFKLGNAEQAWDEDALAGRLTSAAVNAQITRLNWLKGEADKEAKMFLSTKMKDVNADQALLDKQIALINGVTAYASPRLEKLKKISFGPEQPKPEQPNPEQPKPEQPKPAAGTWTCPECGKAGLTGKFCPECGTPRPVDTAAATWTCSKCGKTGLTGRFCPECGAPRP